jgi:hypothetical protein
VYWIETKGCGKYFEISYLALGAWKGEGGTEGKYSGGC